MDKRITDETIKQFKEDVLSLRTKNLLLDYVYNEFFIRARDVFFLSDIWVLKISCDIQLPMGTEYRPFVRSFMFKMKQSGIDVTSVNVDYEKNDIIIQFKFI